MLVKIINNWTYDGIDFVPNNLVVISTSLFDHISSVNVAQKIEDQEVEDIFNSLANCTDLTSFSGEKIEKFILRESEEMFYFQIRREVDGADRIFHYSILKDTDKRRVE